MSTETLVHRHGVPVLLCAPDGPPVRTEADALDLIGAALGHGAELVELPVERLTDEFFTLRTRLAGEVVQKFANYRLRLVVVGDIADRVAGSGALDAFVAEANRGRQLWFVASRDELDERLRPAPAGGDK